MPETSLIFVCDHRGEGLADTLRPLSSAGFRLEISTSLGGTRQALPRAHPALIVVDPLARGGVVELEQLRRGLGEPLPPVLIVADPGEPLPTILAARQAAGDLWDVVSREAPLEEFLMRIGHLRGQVEGRAELDRMRYRAAHDDRTELLRPAPFQARLREHFSAAQRHHFDLALVLVDLDRFGAVNKEFDHTVGDQVISRVGEVVRDTLRAEDVGGRVGGDEFAVVLPYTRRVDAALVVNRLREQIHGLSGTFHCGPRLQVSASLGFETFAGTDLDSVETLRRHSEVALRRAKLMGGNRGLYYRSLDVADGEAPPTVGDAEQTA